MIEIIKNKDEETGTKLFHFIKLLYDIKHVSLQCYENNLINRNRISYFESILMN